ncbi:MAG: carbohydrate kinase family protein [Patescibacteria group bacterium]
MKKIDFLAIGDIAIDAFIKLKDAHIHCNLKKEDCELCFGFGSKVPFESLTTVPAAGNSSNASVSASRLGLRSALIVGIGNDKNGKDCINSLKKEKVITKFIHKEKDKKTNYHFILWYDLDRTILVNRSEFKYEFPKLPKISWIYLSSIPENSKDCYLKIIEFLKKNPNTKLAFQPGTFQIKLGAEKLKEIYQNTEIFFSNLEEAGKILGIKNKDPLILSKGIQTLGPKIVSITDGKNGAYLYYKKELWHIPAYADPAPQLERTGAGDAFSSTFTSELALGLSPLEAFKRSPINSMSVVQKIGAQQGLLSKEKLEEYLKNAPENYKVKKIN